MLPRKTGPGLRDRRACIAARRCGLMAALLLAAAGSACAPGQPGLAVGTDGHNAAVVETPGTRPEARDGAAVKVAQADDIERQRALATAHAEAGTAMMKRGDRAGAEARFAKALAIFRRLAAQAPGDAGRQQDLAKGHGWFGMAYLEADAFADALAQHRTALDIVEPLAAAAPYDVALQWSLLHARSDLAAAQQGLGAYAEAEAMYAAAMDVAERLMTGRPPSDTRPLRSLWFLYNRTIEVQLKQVDFPGALASHADALEVARHLIRRDPGNDRWRRYHAFAVAGYRKMLAPVERMIAHGQGGPDLRRDLILAYNRIGHAERRQGDLAAALESLRGGLQAARRAVADEPGNAGWQRYIGISHMDIGDVQRADGDAAGALESYRAALAVGARLPSDGPGDAEILRWFAHCHRRIGDMLAATGDPAGALRSHRESLAIARQLVDRNPSNGRWQRDRLASLWALADLPDSGVAWADVVRAFAEMENFGLLHPHEEDRAAEARRRAAAERQ